MNGWASLGYFLTLVVTPALVFAAPTSPPPRPSTATTVSPTPEASPKPREDLPWSYPENADLRSEAGLTPLSRSSRHVPGPWTFATGLRHGTDAERGILKSSTILALSYDSRSKLEYGGEFDTLGILRLGVARQWAFWEDSPRQPFFTIGLRQSLTSDAFLASIVDFQKLKLRLSVGAREIFDAHPGWRTDLSASIGANGPAYAWTLGRSF